MNLLLWILRLLNGVMSIFRQLAGIETVDGTDLISLFLNNDGITKIFFGILIISVVVTAISIIVAIVKAFVNLSGGERKSISKITGQGIGTVFISLLMAGIMIGGISMASSFLHDVNAAFGLGDDSEICNDLFDIAVDDGAYYMEAIYEQETWYNPATGQNELKFDKNGDPVYVYLKDADGNVVLDSNGEPQKKIKSYEKKPVLDENGYPIGDGWTKTGKEAKAKSNWSILDENADTILGDFSKDWPWIFPNHDKQSHEGLIYWGSFNFILGYVATILVLVAVISACLGLVKRIYDIVILFLSLPLIVSTIPLDDGARFKVWRETVISKVILAYGAVFAVNVFMIMVPIITTLHITKIMKMILIVGGGLSISGGMLLFARLFGTDAAESRDMAQSARTLLAGAATGMAGIKKVTGVARGIVGKTGSAGVSATNFLLGKMGKQVATQNNGTSGLLANSGALTTAAMPGSNLGEVMRTAGVQSGTWAKDPTTGRFMSKSRMQEMLSGGTTKKLKK